MTVLIGIVVMLILMIGSWAFIHNSTRKGRDMDDN